MAGLLLGNRLLGFSLVLLSIPAGSLLAIDGFLLSRPGLGVLGLSLRIG